MLQKSLWLFYLLLFSTPFPGESTPLIALREAQNCDGCHKGGRSQKPFLLRRCTLDCQGCHIDPAGASARNEWGYYYSQDQMAMINFFKPTDPLQNQFFFDIHYDGRIGYQQLGEETISFPMASEATFRLKPFTRFLHITYSALLLGRTNDSMFRIVREGDRRFREKFSVMIDEIPLNTYIRAYRGPPMYGLRRPNHTLWIRERIGLGPFATTEAIEAGGTPNVPYWRVSKMTGDPYVEEEERQVGQSYHGGLRGVTLGWHVNVSGWDTQSETHQVEMQAIGGGLNIFDLILYGEKNERTVTPLAEVPSSTPTRLHPSSTITEYTVAYAGILGVMFGAVLETYQDEGTNSKRTNYFIDLHPIPFLQLEYWVRRETGSREINDSLALLHVYFDF